MLHFPSNAPFWRLIMPEQRRPDLSAAVERFLSLHQFTEKPLFSIRASHSWAALSLNELWGYRELLYFLTLRDVKVRYKQTALGAAWAIIQPLFTMIVFTLFFGKLAGVSSDGIPYPLFAFAGLLPWTYFSNAVTSSSNSLVGSANLISKVYFPRMIIPGAAVGAGLVDFAIGFALLAALMAYYGVALTWNLLMLPALVALTAALALSVGLWMSALNVKYRDIRYALPFLIQLWMFVSPIIYPTRIVPERWRWMIMLNPLTGLIENFRIVLLGGREIDWMSLACSAVMTTGLLVYSAYNFKRMERSFADIV
jgi:lipopolysaccharide transport system permease protein